MRLPTWRGNWKRSRTQSSQPMQCTCTCTCTGCTYRETLRVFSWGTLQQQQQHINITCFSTALFPKLRFVQIASQCKSKTTRKGTNDTGNAIYEMAWKLFPTIDHPELNWTELTELKVKTWEWWVKSSPSVLYSIKGNLWEPRIETNSKKTCTKNNNNP